MKPGECPPGTARTALTRVIPLPCGVSRTTTSGPAYQRSARRHAHETRTGAARVVRPGRRLLGDCRAARGVPQRQGSAQRDAALKLMRRSRARAHLPATDGVRAAVTTSAASLRVAPAATSGRSRLATFADPSVTAALNRLSAPV